MADASLTVRGIPIRYEELGEGRPVLLLHGLSLEHRVMTHYFEPVFAARAGQPGATSWRRICPDMPDHGATPALDWLASEDEILDILSEFVDCVVGDERLVVIGQSWGAYLAYALASRMIDRIDGLMLFVPMTIADRSRRLLRSSSPVGRTRSPARRFMAAP